MHAESQLGSTLYHRRGFGFDFDNSLDSADIVAAYNQ